MRVRVLVVALALLAGPAAAAGARVAPAAPGGDVTARGAAPRVPAGDLGVERATTPRRTSGTLAGALPSNIAEWQATFGVPLVPSAVAVGVLLLLALALGVYTIRDAMRGPRAVRAPRSGGSVR